MGLFQQKLSEGNVLSWHDGRSGSLRDWADANDGTPGGNVLLNREGFVFDGASGDIDCGSDFIGTSACTVIAKITPNSGGETAGRIIDNGKLVAYVNSNRITFTSLNGGSVAATAASSITYGQTYFVGMSRDASGALGNVYIDGNLNGTANQDTDTPTSGDYNIFIGNNNGATRTFDGTIHWIATFNEVLTNSEINEISAELDAMKWPSKVTGKAIANVGANPSDSSLIGAWDMKPVDGSVIDRSSGNNNGTITGASHKKTILGDGLDFDGVSSQVLLDDINLSGGGTVAVWIYVRDTATLQQVVSSRTTTGNRFGIGISNNEIIFNYYNGSSNADGDGVTVGLHHFVGTYDGDGAVATYLDGELVTGSALEIAINGALDGKMVFSGRSGTPLDEPFDGTIVDVQMYSETKDANWVAKEYAKGAKAVQFKTDFGAKESIANETAGFLSDTPFEINSGTWKISSDTIGGEEVKVIEDVAAGIISVPTSVMNQTLGEAAYGSWEFLVKRGNGNINITFIADTIGNQAATGQDGYNFQINSDGLIAVSESTNGSSSNKLVTATGVVDTNWRKFKITRSNAGEFSVYMDGELVEANTGTNPFTDNTVTTSAYFCVTTTSTEYKIAYSDRRGDRSIVKKLGV